MILPYSSKRNSLIQFFKEKIAHYKDRKRHKKKLKEGFEAILDTRYFKCNPDASAEIHTLTGHRHLYMYLAAIKSFLRFCEDVAVAVHDDGTLSNKDRILLKTHIEGIKIIGKNFADRKINKFLKDLPNSRKYRARHIILMQLLDCMFFSERVKIINLDSDSLFLRKPDKLIEWIFKENNEIISIYEEEPRRQKEFLSKLNCDLPPHICFSLVCFYKRILDLGLIENILAQLKPSIDWWCVAQNIFPVLVTSKSGEFRMSFFDKDAYQTSGNFEDGQIFRHYVCSARFLIDQHVNDAARVISEINENKLR